MNLEDSLKLWSKFGAQTLKEEAIELYKTVIDSPKGDIVEVGSAAGGTTIVLVGAAEEVGKMVFSVDSYLEHYEGKVPSYFLGSVSSWKRSFEENILKKYPNRVTQFVGFLEDFVDRLPDNLSVVFIDSCHEFDMVKKEFDLLLHKVVPGGVILVHDIGWKVGQLSDCVEGGVNHMVEYCNSLEGLKVSCIRSNLLRVLI